jgi:hypothetical protein
MLYLQTGFRPWTQVPTGLELHDLLFFCFPKPILAASQDLLLFFFRQVSSLFSRSRKPCAQLTFAAVVFQVQARAPALSLSPPATQFAQHRLPVCLGCLVLRISMPELSSCCLPVASITSQERV